MKIQDFCPNEISISPNPSKMFKRFVTILLIWWSSFARCNWRRKSSGRTSKRISEYQTYKRTFEVVFEKQTITKSDVKKSRKVPQKCLIWRLTSLLVTLSAKKDHYRKMEFSRRRSIAFRFKMCWISWIFKIPNGLCAI